MTKKQLKTLQCAYLHSDGHAVTIHEETVMTGGARHTVEYAIIHEKYTTASLAFTGRIVFHTYGGAFVFNQCAKAIQVKAYAPSMSGDGSTEGAKAKGLAIGGITLDFGDGQYLAIHDIPGVLSSGYSYQPDNRDTFNPNLTSWGTAKVAEVIRVKVA